MDMMTNMMGGKQNAAGNLGGAVGAGALGAAGTYGSYQLCKTRMKKCDDFCADCDEGCTKCVDKCVMLASAGAGVVGAVGGGVGSHLGQNAARAREGGGATDTGMAAAQSTGGGGGGSGYAVNQGGGMGAYAGILDEWNAANFFAFLKHHRPAGVDRDFIASRDRKRFNQYFETDIVVEVQA